MSCPRLSVHLAAMLALACWGAAAFADDQDTAAADSGWTLGAGIARSTRPYQGLKDRAQLLPILSYGNSWLSLRGTSVDATVARVDGLTFKAHADYALGDGYADSDASALAGMDRRKGSLWLGPAIDWRLDPALISLQVTGDASGHSNGQQAKLTIATRYRTGRWTMVPKLGLDWQSADYVDYYYGVKPSEALANRPAYSGASTTNLEASIQLGYKLTTKQSLSLEVGALRYGNAIVDSPIVGERTAPIARFAYQFHF